MANVYYIKPGSRSHCGCDESFLDCLKDASLYDDVAPFVGNFFFNILRPSCLAHPGEKKRVKGMAVPGEPRANVYRPRLQCTLYADDNGCRSWVQNPKSIPIKLSIINPNFTFKAP